MKKTALPGYAGSALGVGTQHVMAFLVAPFLRSACSVLSGSVVRFVGASRVRARDERLSGAERSAPTDYALLRANAACAAKQAGKSSTASGGHSA